LVAIFGFIATSVLMACDIWMLWQPKMWVASVETIVATGWCYCHSENGGCLSGLLLPQLIVHCDSIDLVL
jgi:hypothetical protein